MIDKVTYNARIALNAHAALRKYYYVVQDDTDTVIIKAHYSEQALNEAIKLGLIKPVILLETSQIEKVNPSLRDKAILDYELKS